MIGIYLYLKSYDDFQLKNRVEDLLMQYVKKLDCLIVKFRKSIHRTFTKTKAN